MLLILGILVDICLDFNCFGEPCIFISYCLDSRLFWLRFTVCSVAFLLFVLGEMGRGFCYTSESFLICLTYWLLALASFCSFIFLISFFFILSRIYCLFCYFFLSSASCLILFSSTILVLMLLSIS